MSAAGTEAPATALGARQLIDLDHVGCLVADQQQLCDPLAGLELVGVIAVSVQEQNPDLAAVTGVDQARGVDQRDPVLGCEARSWQHESGLAVRDLNRDSG